MFSARAGYAAKSICVDQNVAYIVTEDNYHRSLNYLIDASAQFLRYQVAVSQYKFMKKKKVRSADKPNIFRINCIANMAYGSLLNIADMLKRRR
jgi:hypothetical protein